MDERPDYNGSLFSERIYLPEIFMRVFVE